MKDIGKGRNCDSPDTVGSNRDYIHCISKYWRRTGSVCRINGLHAADRLAVSCTASFYPEKDDKKYIGRHNIVASYILFCRPDEWRRRICFVDNTNGFWIIDCIFPADNQGYNAAAGSG